MTTSKTETQTPNTVFVEIAKKADIRQAVHDLRKCGLSETEVIHRLVTLFEQTYDSADRANVESKAWRAIAFAISFIVLGIAAGHYW